ncbi:protein patched homolog 2-like [Ctenocephalides felis]|uniref:protein patched homolog 2-like n=1 Tax=Ctenocephalides felis TaxID=7515 RepID=UPI000E6E29F6|nr:protein patched homolog 2-like [Ctenocephalides felis]
MIASKPWFVIWFMLFLVIVSSLGLFKFKQEKDPLKLWIDQDSAFVRDTNWLLNTFIEGYRQQNVLITADNVLDPFVLEQVARINDQVLAIQTENENGIEVPWNKTCFKVPIVPTKLQSYAKGLSNTSNIIPDLSATLPIGLYCMIVNSLKLGCLQYNVVDMWKYDLKTIKSLTLDDVLNKLNTTIQSPTLGHPMNYANFLGGVERNTSGHIISAKSILTTWFLNVNFSQVNTDKIGNDAGTENMATNEVLIWEEKFLHLMNNISQHSENFSVFYQAGRSYGDISSATMFEDIDKIMIGVVLMCIYVHIVISQWNCVYQRFTLGSMGMFSIGISFLMTISLCSLFELSYGPVHTSLPFLLMGLGIDDMFVLLACWEKVSFKTNGLSLPHKVSIMLREAGMAVTVTTFTDMAAFIVSSITVLPSLHSFCLYAAVGVFIIYIYTITFVVACFALDQQRIDNNYNGFIPCIKHENYVPNSCSQTKFLEMFLSKLYSQVILTKFGKIIVLISTIAFAALSIKNTLLLEQKFDPMWFIPEDTHLFKYIEKRREYYPQIGFEAVVFIGNLNYSTEFKKIIKLEETLQHQNVISNIDSWIIPFCQYVKINFNTDLNSTDVSDATWNLYLSKYLHSPSGAKQMGKFKFSEPLKCGKPVSNIKASSIHFHLKRFNNTVDSIKSMNQLRKITNEANFTTGDKFCTVWANMFATWSTDEIIAIEIKKNLLLSLGCVMLCALVFISNFNICSWIFLCVLLTVVNVSGWMYVWGLTLDLVSCIALQLSVGLCIDYSTHIGHVFLTMEGSTRTKISINVMKHIGAAVIYGGGSTMLALSTLAFSKAYTFKAFFKIFFLIITFGLYHGLIFLPVILSILGPIRKKHNKDKINIEDDTGKDTMLKADDETNDQSEAMAL